MKRTIIDVSQLELTEKVVTMKRVTKVVKGGRNFRFTALVVVGDGNGHVGAGLGKSKEIPDAIRKGKEDAIKNMITVALDDNKSVTHDFIGKFGSASVLLKKAPEGTGIINNLSIHMIIASEHRQTWSFSCAAETVTNFHVFFNTNFLS